MALVLAGCGEATAPEVVETREFVVITQGAFNPAVELAQQIGATCERLGRENLAPGRIGADVPMYRESWKCSW